MVRTLSTIRADPQHHMCLILKNLEKMGSKILLYH